MSDEESFDYDIRSGSVFRNYAAEFYIGSAEKTFQESSYDPDSLLKPYNPDDIYQKRGDYSIYEEMVDDDQVSVALNLKKDLVLGSGWDIIIEDDDQEEMRDELYSALSEYTDKPFTELLEEILTAYEFGFSISEKIFKTKEDGQVCLKTIKTRHPNTWLIQSDQKGNIQYFEQQGLSQNIKIEPFRVIHYVNRPRFQNHYGTSDLRACYAAWFTKRQIIRYYAIFLERTASPKAIGRYDKNAPKTARDAIFNALKKLQAKTAILMPKEIETEFLEAKSNGEAFIKGINIFNMFIGRSLLVPDLVGLQGSETGGGSYSLGVEQLKIFYKHIGRRREALERIINQEIVKPIVIANYGMVENFPKFKFRDIDDSDIIEYTKLWLDAVKGRVFIPNEEEINHFRSIVKFPEGDVIAYQPQEPAGVPALPTNEPLPDLGQEGQDDLEENEQYAPLPEMEIDRMSSFAKVFDLPKGDYSKKVDFKKIESQMIQNENRIITQAGPIIDEIYQDLFEQLERKRILPNQRADKIDTLKLRGLSKLRKVLASNFKNVYDDSQLVAQRELVKSPKEFAVLPDKKFLDVLEAELFQYIGDWEYGVIKEARKLMIQAIKDGKPLSSVVDLLNEDGKADALYSLERFSRTKTTEVLNRGRLAFFENSKVVSGYQYAAVLDDRTTDICRGLHSKVFQAGKEPIPPMHFNCRSLLVPITIYEEFKADTSVGSKPIDQFIEDNKGEGFAKQ